MIIKRKPVGDFLLFPHSPACLKMLIVAAKNQDEAETGPLGGFPGLSSYKGTTPEMNLLKCVLLLTVVAIAACIGMKSNALLPSTFRLEERKRVKYVNSNRVFSQGPGRHRTMGKKICMPE